MDSNTNESNATEMPSIETLRRMSHQANRGDLGALRQLRETLDQSPAIWRTIGDLGLAAENAIVRLAMGKDPLGAESLVRKLEELRSELAGTAPTSVEQLAAQRVVLCWAIVAFTDAEVVSLGNVPPGVVSCWLKRQREAGRQYERATMALMRIRRMTRASDRAKERRARIKPSAYATP